MLRHGCGWLFALVLLQPELVFAARLTAVRIGLHAAYARVVLETDAPADFAVVDAAPTQNEVVVRIAASSRAREVKSSLAGTPVVVLAPQEDGTTLARIRAPGPLRVETQVLAAPPRVVVDLHPAPPGEAASTPEPSPEPPAAPPAEAPVAGAEPAVVPEAGNSAPAAPPPPIAGGEPEPAPVETPPSVPDDGPLPSVAAPPPAARAASGLDARSLAMGFALGVGLVLLGFVLRRPRTAAPEPALPPIADFEIEAPDPFAPSSEIEPSADFDWVALDSAETPDRLVPQGEAEPTGTHEVAPAASPELPDPFVPRSEAEPSGETYEAAASPEPPDPFVPRSEAKPSGETDESDLLRMHQRLDARLAEIADRLGELVDRQLRLEARGAAQSEELASQRAAIARLQRSLRPTAATGPPLQVP